MWGLGFRVLRVSDLGIRVVRIAYDAFDLKGMLLSYAALNSQP